MAKEVRLWKISDGDELREVTQSRLDLEERLEDWLVRDISILDPGLLVIGRQVETVGGPADLLCIDGAGDLVVIELKRDRTPREVIAQALDYGSWVKDLSNERITSLAEAYLPETLEDAFTRKFGSDLPETLNGNHKLLVVGSDIDSRSERIIKYLSETHGVNINAATFQYFNMGDGSELLARLFLLEPSDVELQSRTRGSSKRRPNLSLEEFETVADEHGVADLYQRAVAGLEPYLQKQRGSTQLSFKGDFNGSRNTVVSLTPEESNAADGLQFHVYSLRLQRLLNLTEDAVLGLLPSRREPWSYVSSGGPESTGFTGYFASEDEVDRFVAAFARPEAETTPASSTAVPLSAVEVPEVGADLEALG